VGSLLLCVVYVLWGWGRGVWVVVGWGGGEVIGSGGGWGGVEGLVEGLFVWWGPPRPEAEWLVGLGLVGWVGGRGVLMMGGGEGGRCWGGVGVFVGLL